MITHPANIAMANTVGNARHKVTTVRMATHKAMNAVIRLMWFRS